jgi:FSR family fosmidomycin resistance protein-like MFS transporter
MDSDSALRTSTSDSAPAISPRSTSASESIFSPGIVRVASAHLIVDGYTNVYAPLLPLLIPKLGLSLFAAGALAMIFQLAASVSQLGFGRLADRWHPRRLLIAGPIITVVMLSLIGVAPTTTWLAVVLIVGGLGAAMFHPPGAMMAHRLGAARPSLAMSIFIGGGTIGFAVSPLMFGTVSALFGEAATVWLMLPGLIGLAIVLRGLPPLPPAAHDAEAGGFAALRPYAKPLGLLYTIVVLRTVTALSFVTFLPVMLSRRGLDVGHAGVIVATYLLASSAGGFVGGTLADRFGPKRVIAGTLVAAVPFLMAAPFLEGTWFAIVLAIGGFFLQSTQPLNVAYGQAVAPVSAATVSSLMMGVAWGTGGLMVPVIGIMADRLGIELTLSVLSALPAAAAMCVAPLPALPGQHVVRAAEVGISEPE